MTIERIKPDPVPQVHPLWEFKADGDLRDAYEAYKSALQVPWVGVVSMAYAHYRTFFDTWWAGVAPLVSSQKYVDAGFALRDKVEEDIARLSPPPIVGRLTKMGYSPRELDEMRDMIEVISHGNFVQLPAVFAARRLLEGGEFEGGDDAGPRARSHRREVKTPFILMEPHHTLADHRTIYDDVMATLGLPFVNTDYRCLSRWPSYFEQTWGDLRPHIKTLAYEGFAQEMHEAIFAATAALPNPGRLTAQAVQEAAARDAGIEDVLNVTKLFTWLLPGLMINVAFFRAQLMD